MTQRSEEEVCLALHDCNYDLQEAVNMLYETMTESQWSIKKKKSRQPSSKQEKQTNDETANTDEWNENQGSDHRDQPRSKSGGPRRGGDGGSRGWRGREKQENERNLDPEGRNDFGRERRGRPGGSGGGRGGGRGGRGGGRGRYPPRGGNRNNSYNRPIDTWDNNNPNTWDNNTVPNTNPVEETWDDFPGTEAWTTEEYTGSLADTKIFTPSAAIKLEDHMENQHEGPLDTASQQLSQTLQINQQSGQMPSQSPVPMVGTLNAAQTKYLNQLTQQNSDNYTNIQTFQSQTLENPSQQYNPGSSAVSSQGFNSTQAYGAQPTNTYVNNKYPVTSNYGTTSESVPSQQPLRTKTQRARVPPPSKIPSSAVEMPGDLNSSIGYLDVQFGAMDFMSDSSSFDGVVDQKYGTTNSSMENAMPTQTANMDLSNSNQNSNLDAYSPKTNAQSSISSALTQNIVLLPPLDTIPTSDNVSGAGSYSVASRTSAPNSVSQSASSQAVLDMGKQTDGHSYTQNSTYNSYQSKSYNSTYNASQTTASSYQPSNSYVNSQTGSYSTPSGNAYQNSYSSATSYQSSNNSAAFPSITQANSYSGTNQSYTQNASQSVYGASTGLNNSSSYGNTSSTNQYNNYSSAANKLKDTVYDGTNAVSSSQTTAATSIVTSSATHSLSQSTVSSSKTTTTLAAKNSSNVVSNMPPGVAPPVMSTPYNMVQVPYYQQPLYSYEEMQLLQQRLPHMTAPFYDLSYQTPTTLATVRDATLGNVGYSMSDGRFTRGDNNASPVPSTLSQQTSTQAGHQAQPILAGTAAPPYFFAATHFNTIPNYPFYQLPAVTNAHGTNSNSQYPKPGGYSSGYGAYDALSQTQDYGKGAYVGNTQGQKATSGTASSTGSTGNDLTAMYGKSHTALGKVNSYEKQGFHSGTPPPFTGTLHGSQNAGLAPSGTGYAPPVYIPAMPPHQQHHSTQLMHQPLHQMDVRHQGRRVDTSNNSGQRSQTSNQAKASGKQYTGSYWNQS